MAMDPNSSFAARVAPHDGRPVVAVSGEIDTKTAGEFRRAIESAIAGHGRIEVDLSDATFMDSTGLSVLVAAYHDLGQAREAIVLRSPPPPIRKVLDISGVDALFDIRDV